MTDTNIPKPQEKSVLLIFDLDLTLVSTVIKQKDENNPDTDDGRLIVSYRPYIDVLLGYVKDKYKLALWSAGSKSYVNLMAQKIADEYDVEWTFVNTGEDCLMVVRDNMLNYYKIVRLAASKYNFCMEKVILIEDNVNNVNINEGNSLLIEKYDPLRLNDDCLLKLKHYLESIENVHDVTTLDTKYIKNDQVVV